MHVRLKGHRRGSSASKEDLDKVVADIKAKAGKAIAVKGATSPKRTTWGGCSGKTEDVGTLCGLCRLPNVIPAQAHARPKEKEEWGAGR
jgi:hypothetical protein